MTLANRLDWVAKYRMVNGYRERHGLGWRDPKLLAMDLQYHDVRPERSLYARAGMERLLEPDGGRACHDRAAHHDQGIFQGEVPPALASGHSRGELGLARFRPGERPAQRRVPMMEPLRGTAAHVDQLLARCNTPAELLEQLGS